MALDFGKLNFSTSFNPTSAFPLDARCYFESLDLAKAAVKGAEAAGNSDTVYYFGQQIAVVANDVATLYIVEKKVVEVSVDARGYIGELKEVGSKTLGDDRTIVLENGILSLNEFGKKYNKYVAATEEVAAHYEKVDGFKAGLQPQIVVDENDNTKFHLEWFEPNPTTVEGLSAQITALDGRVSGVEAAIGKKAEGEEAATGIYAELDAKVAKEADKSLVADAEITKLAGVSEGANKVEASEQNGYIKIDGNETKVYEAAAGTVVDADYKHITVTASSVSDGTNTFEKYNDAELAGRVTTIEGDYLKAADKTELEGKIAAKQDELAFEGTYDKDNNKVATASYVLGEVGKIKVWSYKVVDALPEQGEERVIYMVPKGEGQTGYKEYIFIPAEGERAARFEEIGDTDIDLSQYRKSADQDAIDATKVDKVEGYGLSKNDLTDDLKNKLDAIEAGAQVNVIEKIKLNGEEVAVGEGKLVDLGELVLKSVFDGLEAKVGKAAEGETAATGLYKEIADEITRATGAEKALSDRIDIYDGLKEGYDDAVAKKHEHANKELLDGIAADNLLGEGQKTKLEGIEAGAQVNVIEKIKLNGSEVAVGENKTVDLGNVASDERVTELEKKVNGYTPEEGEHVNGVIENLAAEVTRATGVEAGLRTDVDAKLAKADLADEVAKLEIAANKVIVEKGEGETADKNLVTKLSEIDTEVGKKVDAVEGKGLSTNDFDDAAKTKLEGIAEGAEANVLEGVQVADNDVAIANKKANIALGDGLKFDTTANKIYLDLSDLVISGGNAFTGVEMPSDEPQD